MDLASVTAANAPLAAATTESQSRKSLSSDLDTFLKLLTAQIENQDPLEPADGTEYAAQLAQFSSVEQSVRTNELLAEMGEKLARQDMAIAANWIGMDVRHAGPIALSGEAVRLHMNIPSVADRAELVVIDARGDEVLRRPIDPSTRTLDWSGGDGRGGTLPEGIYTVKTAASAGSSDLGQQPVSHYAAVREVTLGTAGANLILPGGVTVSIADLDALRQAS